MRLHRAGVRVIVSLGDSGSIRNDRFEAGTYIAPASNLPIHVHRNVTIGWMIEEGLSWVEALQSITLNPAVAHHLPLPAGRIMSSYAANFVLYNGDPLSLASHTQLVAIGTHVSCRPQQP